MGIFTDVADAGFAFERRARPRRVRRGLRGLFGGAPGAAHAREAGERLARLVPRAWKDARIERVPGGIAADLHRFAPPLRVAIGADGELGVRGEAAGVGPGYVDDALARLAPILDELDYVWDGEPDPRAEIAAWLAGALRGGATRIGMPAGRRFLVDAAVQTAMGPRDAAWRDAVLADPAAGRDAFAWWQRGAGHAERARAVLAMWHDVPWREPIDSTELAVMQRVDGDLAAARAADRALALPYAEWADLVEQLGDAARAAELRALATGPAEIGYRRFDMELALDGGWSITLPGAFVGAWEDDGARYWATDGARVIELTCLETTEQDSRALLAVAPERHPVIARLADGDRHGRAEVYDEDDVHIVHGLVAIAPRVAILTCKGRARDQPWALATWRSLRATP
jgi:hypothetical protein